MDDNWERVYHPTNAMGPYAFKGNQWVGYDDVAQVRRKSQFVQQKGYGGAMIWALDLDDFANVCGCENYPLLKTINRVLRDYPSPGNMEVFGSLLRLLRHLFSQIPSATGSPTAGITGSSRSKTSRYGNLIDL